jgi:hypothetical protein
MKTKLRIVGWIVLLALSALNQPLSTAFAQGTAFTYQGRLNNGANPAGGIYDLRFTIYDAATNGNTVSGVLTNAATAVSNGLFTVTLDFGSGVFYGANYWLDIGVRTNGPGAFTPLTPRQALTPTPYAIYSATAGTALTAATANGIGNLNAANIAQLNVLGTAAQATGVPVIFNGFIVGANVISGGAGYVTPPTMTVNDSTGSGAVVTANILGGAVVSFTVQNAGHGYSSGATLTAGLPPSNAYQTFLSTNYFTGVNTMTNADNVFAGNFTGNGAGLTNLPVWQLAGNMGTSPAGNNFLGTADNQPLEFRVNNVRALRIEPTTNDAKHTNAVNVIGGAPVNYVAPGVVGATIGGGGATFVNGPGNRASNSISSDFGTISGGYVNTIQGNAFDSVIGGGVLNMVQTNSSHSTIGGGLSNVIQTNANCATIPGGGNNIAGGSYSFAAGKGAQATNTGAFVWSDASTGNFGSTTNNQFNVRAVGGVRIVTGGTGMTLDGQPVLTDANASNLTVNGTLNLPAPSIIYSGGDSLLYADYNNNFFVGQRAGNLTTSGGGNSGVGSAALKNNTSGYGNTALGYIALGANTEGSYNTAIGYQTLNSNTNGDNNTASGANVLFNNTSGSHNTASGTGALYNNTSGSDNLANGQGALKSNTNGNFNTAVGGGALYYNTSGSGNIALGYNAGYWLTTGSGNICIGSLGNADDTNTMRIGSSQTQTFLSGIYGTTAASGVAVYINPSGQLGTLTSSRQYKQDIRDMNDASAALLALQPVTFRYKPDIDPQSIPQFGLVAEDVEKVNPDLVAHDNQGRPYTVRYEAVNAMLLNEFLKEHKKIEAQNTEIQDLKARLEKLEQFLNARNGGAK